MNKNDNENSNRYNEYRAKININYLFPLYYNIYTSFYLAFAVMAVIKLFAQMFHVVNWINETEDNWKHLERTCIAKTKLSMSLVSQN